MATDVFLCEHVGGLLLWDVWGTKPLDRARRIRNAEEATACESDKLLPTKAYQRSTDKAIEDWLRTKLGSWMHETKSKRRSLVVFPQFVDVVSQMLRAVMLRTKGKDVLLLGRAASGKCTAARFVAHLCGLSVVQVTCDAETQQSRFWSDVKQAIEGACLQGNRVMVVLREWELDRSMLAAVNHFLLTGTTNHLLPQADVERIVRSQLGFMLLAHSGLICKQNFCCG